MKKLFTILALALAMVACQKDGNVEEFSNGDLATVTLNLDAPALGVTRAGENGQDDATNGKESAYGAIDYADEAFWAEYDLRYILEVYSAEDDGKGENIARERLYSFKGEYEPTEFQVRLVPNRTYKFVVWADFVLEGTQADLYYNTADLRAISAITTGDNWNAMNEARDAYFVSQNLDIKKDVAQNLTLKRPLAKIRVVTTDKKHWAKYSQPSRVVVSYYESELSTVFNAVNGQIDTTKPLQILYDVVYADAESQYNETDTHKTLFTDYLFVKPAVDGQTPIHFTMDVYEGANNEVLVRSNDFCTEIPIKRNHLTTIYGDILTTMSDIYVGINDNFDLDPDLDVKYDENQHNNDAGNSAPVIKPEGENAEGVTEVSFANGAYTIATKEGIDVNIKASALTDGKLAMGVYTYGVDFTVDDFDYAVPATASKFNQTAAATVKATVVGGTMEVLDKTTGEKVIDLELNITYKANETDVEATAAYTMTSKFEFAEIKQVALATPVVDADVEGNVVTLTWEAVEGASHYTVQVDDDVEEVVEASPYVFEGDYEVEYTFTVKAIAADTTVNTDSEATVVKATTEAKPSEEPVEQVLTVAEFLALTDVVPSNATDEVIAAAPRYTLTGTITSVTNTSYGNFYLNDGTGEVLIYGLVGPEGESKYWAASGAKVGDDITVKTIRTEYNKAPQGKNATFVEVKTPGTLAFFTLSSAAVDFPSAGGESTVTVTAYNTTDAVTAVSNNDAFDVEVDGYNVKVSAAANEIEEAISGQITVKVGDLEPAVINVSLAAKPADGQVEGGADDFNTISATNTSYVSGKTTAGWSYANCAIFKGGTSDSSPAFKMIGDANNRALCMNGKTSAVGTITSPTINTGCGTLKFNYGLPFGDTKIKFRVDIKQNGEVVKSFTVDNPSATKLTKYSHEEAVNVAGEFQIVFTNLSPSNSTSNKDRTAIWDVEWTGVN